jgi:hypothetical protein
MAIDDPPFPSLSSAEEEEEEEEEKKKQRRFPNERIVVVLGVFPVAFFAVLLFFFGDPGFPEERGL